MSQKDTQRAVILPIVGQSLPKNPLNPQSYQPKIKKVDAHKALLKNVNFPSPERLITQNTLYIKNKEIRSKIIDKKLGRESIKYKNKEQILYILNNYLDLCLQGKLIPTLSGFACVLYGSRYSYNKIKKKCKLAAQMVEQNEDASTLMEENDPDADPELYVILKHCEERIFAWQLDKALKGEISNRTFVWQGINLHNLLSTKTDSRSTSTSRQEIEETRTVRIEATADGLDASDPLAQLPPELRGLIRQPKRALDLIRRQEELGQEQGEQQEQGSPVIDIEPEQPTGGEEE